eukprot:3149051-Prymnesium_polylepis.1
MLPRKAFRPAQFHIPSLARVPHPLPIRFAQCARGYSRLQRPSLWLAPLFEVFTVPCPLPPPPSQCLPY